MNTGTRTVTRYESRDINFVEVGGQFNLYPSMLGRKGLKQRTLSESHSCLEGMGRTGVMLKTREYDIMSLLFRREVVEFIERSQCTQPF